MSCRKSPRGVGVKLLPEEAIEAYRDISETLKKAFNATHEYHKIKGVDWPSIRICLRTLGRYNYELKLFWKAIYLLFEYFEKLKNPELLPVVADVLHFIVFESFYSSLIFPQKSLQRSPSVLSDRYRQKHHNILLKLMKVPYRLKSSIIPGADFMWRLVLVDSKRLLPILLRQGVAYIPPSSHMAEWNYCIKVLYSICKLSDVWQEFDPPGLMNDLEAENPVVRRRIFTVFRAMDVVVHKVRDIKHWTIFTGRRSEGNVIDRHRLIFDTIPEPIVTLQEVRNILEMIFEPLHTEVVNSFSAHFEEFLPESAQAIAPRSLKHLVRCQIRENLRLQGVFPYGVYKLPIPEPLKRYVLLENWYPSDAARAENEKLVLEEEGEGRKTRCCGDHCATTVYQRHLLCLLDT